MQNLKLKNKIIFYGSNKMSIVYDQVVHFAKQIQKGLNKVIYVKDGVYLIDKSDLPNKYYQKTAILFVDNPKQYLKEINNKEPTQQEINQFKFISIPKINETIYADIMPPELIREHLLSLT